MNKGITIGIPIIIVIIVGVIVISMTSMEQSDDMEVEDAFDKEISPEETPEVTKKIEDIEGWRGRIRV